MFPVSTTLQHSLQTSEYYYGGVAATVPGVIQAEEFDNGGEGVGYSDKTIENEGGVSDSSYNRSAHDNARV